MQEKKSFYNSHDNKSELIACNYNKTSQALYRYLAYRDIPNLILKYVVGNIALDYGSGTGISSQFLISQGFDVDLVDVSEEMLNQAQQNCSGRGFSLLKDGLIPADSGTYDLVFSSFVLFELGSPDKIVAYMKEAKRVLKKNGIFIAVTGSNVLYTKNWLCLGTDFPENTNLISGKKVKLFVPENNMEFTDYYWTESDYCSCYDLTEFTILESYYPLGNSDEQYPWKDEMQHSPFVIFIAKPKS